MGVSSHAGGVTFWWGGHGGFVARRPLYLYSAGLFRAGRRGLFSFHLQQHHLWHRVTPWAWGIGAAHIRHVVRHSFPSGWGKSLCLHLCRSTEKSLHGRCESGHCASWCLAVYRPLHSHDAQLSGTCRGGFHAQYTAGVAYLHRFA